MKLITKKAIDKSKEDIILFVHGAWHGAWCWERYFMPYFAERGYDNYALTWRLHDKPGKIKGINSLTFANYVEDLVNAVRQLPQTPIIVAHSMGGMVLQKYLEKHTCKKAIFLASGSSDGFLKLTMRLTTTRSYAIPSVLFLDLFLHVNHPDKIRWAFFSKDAEEEEIQFCAENVCSESLLAYLQMQIPRIKVNENADIPILVLGAEDDTIITVKENKKTAKKYQADCIILPDIAHDMMLDTKRNIAAATIIEWLEK